MVQEYWKTTTHAETKLKEKYVMDTMGQFPFNVWITDFQKKIVFECGKDHS